MSRQQFKRRYNRMVAKFRGKHSSTKRALDARYADNWDNTARLTRKLVGNRCCFPGCKHQAVDVHHSCYSLQGKAIAGKEIPLVMVFPLCAVHHDQRDNPDCAHHPRNWHKGTAQAKYLDARNTPEYYKLLRQGAEEKLLPEYRK